MGIQRNNSGSIIFAIALAWILFCMGIVGGLIYVIFHFITKFW